MRIICPHCQKTVTLPDGAAGQPLPCPLCGHVFTPPALAGSALDLPPVPPAPPPAPPIPTPPAAASAPPTPAPQPMPTTAAASTSATSTADGLCCSFTLRRDTVRWLAPIGLVVAFVLTFLTWVSCAPGGYPVYTQSAWGAAFGGTFSHDNVGNNVMKKFDVLDKKRGWGLLMVTYLLGLVLTTVLALGDRFSPETMTVPDVFKRVWERRRWLVSALCVVLFLLLAIQCLTGFGLEGAVAKAADEAVPEAQGAERLTRDVNYAIEVNSFGLRRTWWWTLAVLAQLIAAIGVGLTLWFERRGAKPEPRVEFYC